MVNNYNILNLGTGSRTTTGVLVPGGIGGDGSIDTSQTDWLAFQLTISGSATVQVETSFDNGTTYTPVYVIKGSDSTTAANATASGLYFGNSIGSRTRLNVTAVTGTVTLVGGTTDVTNAPNGTPGSVVLGNGSNIIGTVQEYPAAAFANAAQVASAASTNASVIKASNGVLTELDVSNLSAATVFVKLYNKASAPTVGTDVPVLTIPVGTGVTTITEFGVMGKRFSTGIALAITGAAADTDTTAITTGVKVGATYV